MQKSNPPGTRYPWESWFSKGRFTLEKGTHYMIKTSGMMAMIRRAARRHGVKVRINIKDDEQGISCTVLGGGPCSV